MRAILVRFDMDRLREQLIAPLAAKHFGAGDASEYVVRVASRGSPDDVIFSQATADAPLDPAHVDLAAGMFDLRLDALTHLGATAPGVHAPGATERMAITIVRRAPDGAAPRVAMTGGQDQGKWQVLVRHRRGSLDAVVARSRRRNLAISVGVLGLLTASFLLTLASARRQRRLARQQMEFVASVSHELRTPLAVICSAGENLADGVVADRDQVKRYGTLVETEGRRLADTVERVMAFAGITSGTPHRPHGDVDVSALIAEAVSEAGLDARDRGVAVTVRSNGPLPPVRGDADALALRPPEPGRQRREVQPERCVGGGRRRAARGVGADSRGRPRPRHRRRRSAPHLQAVLPRTPCGGRGGARLRRRPERRASRRRFAPGRDSGRKPRGGGDDGRRGPAGESPVVSVAPRVLLVEDEAGLRLTLSDRLASEGYQVDTASDGEAGLASAASGAYNLVVLDVMLPKMNGFDVCRAVRQRGVTTPILMLTARGQVVDKVVGLKLGADDYLTKPFEAIELMARLEALAAPPAIARAAGRRDVSLRRRRGRLSQHGSDARGASRSTCRRGSSSCCVTSSSTAARRCRATRCCRTCGATTRCR